MAVAVTIAFVRTLVAGAVGIVEDTAAELLAVFVDEGMTSDGGSTNVPEFVLK